jgi:hypothetical protein
MTMTATNKTIPGKRMKTWWRRSDRSMALKAYARFMAKGDDDGAHIARVWLASKKS